MTDASYFAMAFVILNLTVGILLLAYNAYFLRYRNNRTAAFLRNVSDMIFAEAERRLEQGRSDWKEPYNLIGRPPYRKVLYSFKPFKLEAWYTDEEIKLLKGDADDEDKRDN